METFFHIMWKVLLAFQVLILVLYFLQPLVLFCEVIFILLQSYSIIQISQPREYFSDDFLSVSDPHNVLIKPTELLCCVESRIIIFSKLEQTLFLLQSNFANISGSVTLAFSCLLNFRFYSHCAFHLPNLEKSSIRLYLVLFSHRYRTTCFSSTLCWGFGSPKIASFYRSRLKTGEI